jgi:hypothetical protein
VKREQPKLKTCVSLGAPDCSLERERPGSRWPKCFGISCRRGCKPRTWLPILPFVMPFHRVGLLESATQSGWYTSSKAKYWHETDSEQVPWGKDEKTFEKRVKECVKPLKGKPMCAVSRTADISAWTCWRLVRNSSVKAVRASLDARMGALCLSGPLDALDFLGRISLCLGRIAPAPDTSWIWYCLSDGGTYEISAQPRFVWGSAWCCIASTFLKFWIVP